jgi:hypothetical protein
MFLKSFACTARHPSSLYGNQRHTVQLLQIQSVPHKSQLFYSQFQVSSFTGICVRQSNKGSPICYKATWLIAIKDVFIKPVSLYLFLIFSFHMHLQKKKKLSPKQPK